MFGRDRLVGRVLDRQRTLTVLSDTDVRRQVLTLRRRSAAGEKAASLLPDAFAAAREAARRALGIEHYPVQLLGGAVMAKGGLAEMATGEGKTLTASLPLVLHALAGRGAHLATVNDYLTARDAEWLRPVYEALGLTLGVVLPDDEPEARRAAYRCDVTYAVASELAFDHLRDRLTAEALGASLAPTGEDDRLVQRRLQYVLVDEADSVLIDDARTPYLISGPAGEVEPHVEHAYRWAAGLVSQLSTGADYVVDPRTKEVTLTEGGVARVRRLAAGAGVTGLPWDEVYLYAERAVKVATTFRREEHYVVREGEVVLVTGSTGRLAEGRQYSGGIHQAIEAREGLAITGESRTTASITVQAFFRRYRTLSGMTGTAASSRGELRRIYGTPVTRIPTHRPCRRVTRPTAVYATQADAFRSVALEARSVREAGRPVLIGAQTIEQSTALSACLAAAGIAHDVLNAHRHEEEAAVVASAGQAPGGLGRVTVATNMAGRGTDIKLPPEVAAAGGLHVIVVGMADSPRVDRQLAGRAARQGDPGTVKTILALDDELLTTTLSPGAVEDLRRRYAPADRGPSAPPSPLPSRLVRLFAAAQRRMEARHALDRRRLIATEKQRSELHRSLGQDPCLFAAD